jgi:3-(methylthio)propanoyl-CoA dehydrogenase
MVKYCSTEMGNRVCYQSMQVHGGVGYMREFNIERLFRDVRITNIYEGTSQLQVVAAIGKLLNRTLDPLLAEWAAAEYPADMAAEKAILVELTALYQKAVDALKAQGDRDRVDYYACDLVDCAVWLVNSWLLMRDTNLLESKKYVARTYVAAIAPRLRASADQVIHTNPAPLEAIPALLG